MLSVRAFHNRHRTSIRLNQFLQKISKTKIGETLQNLKNFYQRNKISKTLAILKNLQQQFRSKSIIIDQTKFDYIITALDNRATAEVKAVLLNPPKQGKYNDLKTALLNALGKSQLQKDAELLNISGLGDKKLSAFLRYLEFLNSQQ